MSLTAAYLIIGCFIFVFGLCIGSFLNVVIYRVPLGISIAKGRSFCPRCHAPIAAYDNIPVLSWLLLRGKCRHCGEPIAWRYPLVELLGGISALVSVACYGLSWMTLIAFAVVEIVTAIAFIDWDHMIIPNGLIIALAVPAALSFVAEPSPDIKSRLIGVVVVALPLFLMALFMGAFGMGDIKLMAVAGFLLGWQNTLVAGFIGLVLAGCVGIVKMARKTGEREMAFGPYLSMGIGAALLFGPQMIAAYLGFFGLI
ncbi:MAG: prepilin peptidase [Eubacteriaceae bacterium]|nr:prepilin peptidase [Eubacteriaceae bacterium]